MSKSPAPPPDKVSLVDALQAAGAEDLRAIEEQILDLERQLGMLREAAKLLTVKLHGKPKQTARKTPGCTPQLLRERIYDCITANGPGTVADIALKLQVSEHAVRLAVGKSDWFVKLESGKVSIAHVKGGRE